LDFGPSLNFIRVNIARDAINERTFRRSVSPATHPDFRDNALPFRIFIHSPLSIAAIKKALHDFPDY
jgi:hypothetical protein